MDFPQCFGSTLFKSFHGVTYVPGMRTPVERTAIMVNISKATRGRIQRLLPEHGITQQDLAGRVLDWFARQDRTARAMILNGVTAADILIYAEKLRTKSEPG